MNGSSVASEVLAAVRCHGDALQHAAWQRRQDKSVVLAAVEQSGRALQAAAKHLKDDEEQKSGIDFWEKRWVFSFSRKLA